MSDEHQDSLELEVQRRDRKAVVRLCGSLGIAEVQQLREELERLVADKAPLTVLDLGALEFIGSAGLSAIVHSHLRNRHHDGQIRLTRPLPAVREVLERTRLTSLFPIYASVEQALEA